MVDYVLSNFDDDEIEEKNAMINRVVESIETIVRHGPAKAMSMINSGSLWNIENKSEQKQDAEKNDS